MAKPSRACGTCPPDQQERQRYTAAAWTHASSRHSGFAISKSRTGSKQQQRSNREQCSDRLSLSDFGFRISDFGSRPVLPAEPEEIQSEKRNEPAEVVLLVDRPFAAEFSAKSKP